MEKPFTIGILREITDQNDDGYISYAKMVEMLNDIAIKWHEQTISKMETDDYKMKSTQTAVEWLWNELVDKGYFKRLPISEIKQAKAMEKTQRIEDYKLGYKHGIGDTSLSNMTINKTNKNNK